MTEVVTQKLIGEMSDAEFRALVEQFIERETQGTAEVPADVLFEALPDFFAAAEIQRVEVDGELRGDRLVLSIPGELPTEVREVELHFPAMQVVVSMIPQRSLRPILAINRGGREELDRGPRHCAHQRIHRERTGAA